MLYNMQVTTSISIMRLSVRMDELFILLPIQKWHGHMIGLMKASQNLVRLHKWQWSDSDEYTLTRCGLVMPFGVIDLGHYWLTLMPPSHNLNQWWLPISTLRGSHMKALSQWVLRLLVCIIISKIILLKVLPHVPGASELMYQMNPLWRYRYSHNLMKPCAYFMGYSALDMIDYMSWWLILL